MQPKGRQVYPSLKAGQTDTENSVRDFKKLRGTGKTVWYFAADTQISGPRKQSWCPVAVLLRT
jgi:hypothetical protein